MAPERVPAVSVAIVALALAATFAGADRTDPALWPLVHLGAAHLALDAAALIAVGLAYERRAGAARWSVWAALCAAAGVVAGGIASASPIIGLSATAHGLLAAGALCERREARLGAAILALLVVKVGIELMAGAPLASVAGRLVQAGPGASAAHAGGLLAGVVLGLACRRLDPSAALRRRSFRAPGWQY